jgi:hypothetical protein
MKNKFAHTVKAGPHNTIGPTPESKGTSKKGQRLKIVKNYKKV